VSQTVNLLLILIDVYAEAIIVRAHSFPWNFEPSCGIFPLPRNFAEVENSAAISTFLDLMLYFYHGKNQTELPKTVGPTNSYCNMAQS